MSLRKHHTAFCLVTATALLALTGCGVSDSPDSSASPDGSTPSTTVSTSTTGAGSANATVSATDALPTASGSSESTPTPSDSDSPERGGSNAGHPTAQPTTTPPPGAAVGGAAASVENCNTQSLGGRVDSSPGSGSVNLVFINNGYQACMLTGFPEVSSADDSGNTIGLPSRQVGEASGGVMLLPGESTTVAMTIKDTTAQAQTCNPHSAVSFAVYPPENNVAMYLPYEHQACGNPKIVQLEVTGFGV